MLITQSAHQELITLLKVAPLVRLHHLVPLSLQQVLHPRKIVLLVSIRWLKLINVTFVPLEQLAQAMLCKKSASPDTTVMVASRRAKLVEQAELTVTDLVRSKRELALRVSTVLIRLLLLKIRHSVNTLKVASDLFLIGLHISAEPATSVQDKALSDLMMFHAMLVSTAQLVVMAMAQPALLSVTESTL